MRHAFNYSPEGPRAEEMLCISNGLCYSLTKRLLVENAEIDGVNDVSVERKAKSFKVDEPSC